MIATVNSQILKAISTISNWSECSNKHISLSTQFQPLSYWLLNIAIVSCQILVKNHKKSWWSHNWLFGSHLPTPAVYTCFRNAYT